MGNDISLAIRFDWITEEQCKKYIDALMKEIIPHSEKGSVTYSIKFGTSVEEDS